MSDLLAQVVAQLRSTIDRLDAIAVQATRAASDVTQGHARYSTVGRGTDHPRLRAAVGQSRTGADKARRIARLSSDAARNVADFLNAVAPGSAPRSAAATSGSPPGEELLADSDRRDLGRRRGAFLIRAARRADDVQDQVSAGVDAVEKGSTALRDFDRPSGAHSSGTSTPTGPGPSPRAKIDGSEAAGHLVVAGLLAGVAAQRVSGVIRQWKARLNQK
ncbi:hypothetical protein [Micromonospora sp. NPDC049801]|uniref:hypothetical protein n=1 Tax=unclassified Micromonospora TaxID=2617518 RepID=UPI0033E8BCE2